MLHNRYKLSELHVKEEFQLDIDSRVLLEESEKVVDIDGLEDNSLILVKLKNTF